MQPSPRPSVLLMRTLSASLSRALCSLFIRNRHLRCRFHVPIRLSPWHPDCSSNAQPLSTVVIHTFFSPVHTFSPCHRQATGASATTPTKIKTARPKQSLSHQTRSLKFQVTIPRLRMLTSTPAYINRQVELHQLRAKLVFYIQPCSMLNSLLDYQAKI